MAESRLGPYFDIHCGGEDHLTIHHVNEIAQAEACYGTLLARFWMHGRFLVFDDERMSKSSGSFLTLDRLVEAGYDPLAYRMFLLGAHYRRPLTFNWEALDAATAALERLRRAAHAWGSAGDPDPASIEAFTRCLNSDLNMPQALAVVWGLVRSELPDEVKKGTLLAFDGVLGLGLANWEPPREEIPAEVMEMARRRTEAEEALVRSADWSTRKEFRTTGARFRANLLDDRVDLLFGGDMPCQNGLRRFQHPGAEKAGYILPQPLPNVELE